MSKAFQIPFTTNVVHYSVGRQGAARKVNLVMEVDASKEAMVQKIGRLLDDPESFAAAVQATKMLCPKSHVQTHGGDELFLITLSLKGKGPAKLKRDNFETEGSVHRIKAVVAAENAAAAEIIIRTEGKSTDLATWMVARAGFKLSATFKAAQEKLNLDGKDGEE